METGTLKELNVKPGDVVEWLFSDGKAEGTPYTVQDMKEEVVHLSWPNDREVVHVARAYGRFRIISRATPSPNLTAITTPFGLLDEATQEALRAHGGPYEIWDGAEWNSARTPRFSGSNTYRVMPGPVIENAQVDIYCRGHKASAFIQLKDGKPDWSTLQVRND